MAEVVTPLPASWTPRRSHYSGGKRLCALRFLARETSRLPVFYQALPENIFAESQRGPVLPRRLDRGVSGHLSHAFSVEVVIIWYGEKLVQVSRFPWKPPEVERRTK